MLTLVNPSCSLSNYESCFFDVVVSTVDQQKEISAALRYSEDCMGRSVGTDIPRVGLPSGDRLEPSKSFRDVGTFELMPVPFTARVWRGSKEDRITHVSPLFSIEGFATLRLYRYVTYLGPGPVLGLYGLCDLAFPPLWGFCQLIVVAGA